MSFSQPDDRERDPGAHHWVRPNPGAAKTIGILNVIFASLLLLCLVCMSLQLVMQSAMGPMMAAQQAQMQQAMQAQRQQQLQQLKTQEDNAVNEEDKAKIQ